MTRSVTKPIDATRTHWTWHLLFLTSGLLVVTALFLNELVVRWFSHDGHISDEGINYLNLFRIVVFALAGGCIVLWSLRKTITCDFRETFDRWKRVPNRLVTSTIIPSVSPVGLKRILWLLMPLWFVGISINLIPGYEAWSAYLIREKGVFQTITVVCYVFAGIISLRLAISSLRSDSKRGLLHWWLFGLAGFCLFVAAEEINWGELYFGYEFAEFIRQSNYQNQVSLHNVGMPFYGSYWANDLSHIAAVGGGILLPLVIRYSMYFRRLIWAVGAPLPPWLSQACFLFAALIPQDSLLDLQPENIPSEIREITISFGIAIWLWCSMKSNLRNINNVQKEYTP